MLRVFATKYVCGFLMLLFLSVNGCGRSSATTEIEFWTLQLSPTFSSYIREAIAEYERTHPGVSIRWVDVPYDAAIQKLLSSAIAGNAPDVVNLSADFLAKFHGMNALVDLRAPVAAAGFTYLPNALDLCTFNEAIVAVPWYLNTYVAIYNKELLAAAGFSESDVPATFSALTSFIREYKDRTGRFAVFWNIGKDSYLPMMLGSEGVAMTDSAMTRATFNSARGIQLIDEWVRLYREGYLQSESIMKPGSAIVESYQSGNVALILTGPVFLQRIATNAPNIYSQTGISPAIVGATGKHELAAMSLSVLSSSRSPEIAADFALFMTDPQRQLAFSKMTTTFPSVQEALADSFFTVNDRSLTASARSIGIRQLPTATRLRHHLLHEDVDELRDIFDEAVQKACLGSLSTAEAMNAAAAEWNRILAR